MIATLQQLKNVHHHCTRTLFSSYFPVKLRQERIRPHHLHHATRVWTIAHWEPIGSHKVAPMRTRTGTTPAAASSAKGEQEAATGPSSNPAVQQAPHPTNNWIYNFDYYSSIMKDFCRHCVCRTCISTSGCKQILKQLQNLSSLCPS